MLFQQVKHCAVIEVFKDFLVAVRVSSDVVVANEVQVVLDAAQHILAHVMLVIDIVEQADAGRVHLADEVEALV